MNISELFSIITGLFTRSNAQWFELKERNYRWTSILLYITIPVLFISAYANTFTTPPEQAFKLGPAPLFLVLFLSSVSSVMLSALMIAAMAPRFQGNNSYDRVFTLISLSYVPFALASVFKALHSSLQFFGLVGMVLMVYLFLRGVRVLLDVPQHKQLGFSFISLLLLLAVTVIISSVIMAFAVVFTGNLPEVLFQV